MSNFKTYIRRCVLVITTALIVLPSTVSAITPLSVEEQTELGRDNSWYVLCASGTPADEGPASGTDDPGASDSQESPDLRGSTGAEKAYNFFIDEPHNLKPEAAAGIVGNLMQESAGGTEDLDPKIDSGSHYGIAQWDSGRKAGLQALAREKGKPIYDLKTQLEYIWKELNGGYTEALSGLQTATNTTKAMEAFLNKYEKSGEGPGSDGYENRKKYAKEIFDKYGEGTDAGSDTQGGNVNCACGNTSNGGADVDRFLKVLAFQESGGNPTQPGSAGGARGKYQYIDSTWRSSAETYYEPALEYQQAHTAPEAVQDAVAYLEYTKKFKELDNDLFKLAVSHFYPVANSEPAKLDIVPPSNVITPRQYANKLIETIQNGGEWESIPLKYSEAPDFNTWADKVGLEDGSESSGGSATSCEEGGADNADGVEGLKWPLEKKWWDQQQDWFTKPHHDYPAADIPVPSGTKVFSMTDGKVVSAGPNGGAGVAVFIQKDDIVFGYFHGTPGSVKVQAGSTVRAGQLIMLSDNTGNSSGPHLHFQLEINGQKKCPQQIFRDLAAGNKTNFSDVPGTGCTY